MSIPITNGKDTLLTQNSGTLPNVSDAIFDYLQPMTFTRITKQVLNFELVETAEDIDFQGVWQPFTAQQLQMKPEGQRKWKWYTVHALIGVELVPDEVVTYLGEQYRVSDRWEYKLYGYVKYDLCQDYTGSGPG